MSTMSAKANLTAAQKVMYASEKLDNFRWISRLLANRSPHALTFDDLAPVELGLELAELGQYAELAYSTVPLEFVFKNLDTLTQEHFPLEGYDALDRSELLADLFGTTAKLHCFVAWRPSKKQLIVAISGTSNVQQAIHDLWTSKHVMSSGKGSAHAGFWAIYKGMKRRTLEAVQEGLKKYEVDEIVVTGHSLGGAVSVYFMTQLLEAAFCRGKKLKLATFGAPRPGDKKFSRSWQEMVKKYRSDFGESYFTEYAVKAYNDGVPTLPPLKLGFHHCTRQPLYFVHGRLWHIPESEYEYAFFNVPEPEDLGPFPLGGHNYYGRDIEKAVRRRLGWLDKVLAGEENWEERYKEYVKRKERRALEGRE